MLAVIFDPNLPAATAAIIGATLGAGSTIIVNVINAWIGRDKFRRDRLWDRRQEACNITIAELRYASATGAIINLNFSEDPYGYYGSDLLDKHVEQMNSHTSRSNAIFRDNYLILPPAFRRRYDRMLQERLDSAEYGGPQSYTEPIAVTDAAIDDLMDIARRSLGIASTWEIPFLHARPLGKRLIVWCRKRGLKLKRCWKRYWNPAQDEWDF